MKIGIFAHSTNPRGGVVHALHLAEALCDQGHEATLLAPALPGARLFRTPRCGFVPIRARPVADLVEMVACRIDEIAGFLGSPLAPRFDLYHAQDPISANALADLVQRRVIEGFIRTVHHLDHFADPRLNAWQDRGVRAADAICCVSLLWQAQLRRRYGRAALVVGNGVDTTRFTPDGEPADALRARLGLPPGGPVFLAIGGVEARKNTLNILRAFQTLYAGRPDARLLIAGGASLLDHSTYHSEFAAIMGQTPAAEAVCLAGVVEDADMPLLFRLATALVFPSREEGFGLCALEAMASGIPAIVSNRPPFTEHFAAGDCLFTDPDDPAAIACAMRAALDPAIASPLRGQGPAIAARFSWARVAAAHLPLYAAFAEPEQIHA